MTTKPYSNEASKDYFISGTTNENIALYSYNCYNQLIEADTNGVVSSYSYAPDGLRHSKTVGEDTTTFVYDNSNIVEEITQDGANQYYRGFEIIKNDDNLYYIYNGQGDVTILTDSTGTTIADYSFDAYGNQSEENDVYNPFGYRGEYTDEETGFIYLRARYYDTETGRFINEDPIRDGLNWYVYCGGNPVNYVDPLGLIVTAWDKAHCTPEEITKLQEATIQWNQGKLFRNKRMMNEAHLIAENIRNKYRENGEYGSSDGNTGKNGAMYHSDVYYENQTISGSKYNVPILNFSVNYGVGAEANINLNGVKVVIGGKMYYDFTNVASNNPTQSLSFAAEVVATDKFSIGGSYTATIDPRTKQNLANQGYVGIKLGNKTFGFDSLPQKKDFVIELGGGVYIGAGGIATVRLIMSELFRRLFK